MSITQAEHPPFTDSIEKSVPQETAANQAPILVAIIALAFFTPRLAFVISDGLWNDEMFTLRVTEWTYAEIIRRVLVDHHDLHPPIHYLYGKFIRTIFGSSDQAIKIGSMIPLSLVFIHWNTSTRIYNLFGKSGIILFGIIFSLSPYFSYLTTEFRQYGLLMAFCYGAFFAALRIAEGCHRPFDIAVLSVLTALAVFTQYIGAIVISCICLSLLISFPYRRQNLIKFAIASIIPLLLLALYYPILLDHLQKGVSYQRPLSAIWRHISLGYGSNSTALVLLLCTLVTFALTVFNSLRRKRRPTTQDRLLWSLTIAASVFFVFAVLLYLTRDTMIYTFGASSPAVLLALMASAAAWSQIPLNHKTALAFALSTLSLSPLISSVQDTRFLEHNRRSYAFVSKHRQAIMAIAFDSKLTVYTTASRSDLERYIQPVIDNIQPTPEYTIGAGKNRTQIIQQLDDTLGSCEDNRTLLMLDRRAGAIAPDLARRKENIGLYPISDSIWVITRAC